MSIDLTKLDPALRGMYGLNKSIEALKSRAEALSTEAVISVDELNSVILEIAKILERQLKMNQTLVDKIYNLDDNKKDKFRFFWRK